MLNAFLGYVVGFYVCASLCALIHWMQKRGWIGEVKP